MPAAPDPVAVCAGHPEAEPAREDVGARHAVPAVRPRPGEAHDRVLMGDSARADRPPGARTGPFDGELVLETLGVGEPETAHVVSVQRTDIDAGVREPLR